MNALLRFMRPEELKVTETSLNEIAAEIAAQVVNGSIEVRLEFDPLCPVLMLDRSLVGEAIRNVIANAVEAMPKGGTLTLRTTTDGECAELSIEDEGQGIPPELLDQIFQLYFTTKDGGNGLGLALAMRAIDLHQGTIEVESTPDRGTTVRIRLPIGAPVSDPVASRQESYHA